MNFVKMTAGHKLDAEFMTFEAEAVTNGIMDDDNSVILIGEHAGYTVKFMGFVPDPVYLTGGDVSDNIDGAAISFGIMVRDPEGNETTYIPGVSSSKAVWNKQS